MVDREIPTLHLSVAGRVQGVGFRPYVYRLALAHQLSGEVRNCNGSVEIALQGEEEALLAFSTDLVAKAPPLARPEIVARRVASAAPFAGFTILSSEQGGEADIHLPPDHFACSDCLTEMGDPRERRHAYPFINCTQCGPRYTIIAALPYDRPNTTMAGFPLCDACRHEYEAPADRRFHAQPLACPRCGPTLTFVGPNGEIRGNEQGLAAAVSALQAGEVVAVKGIGGYHLLCDARSNLSVERLRRAKPRPHKPLAVMFPQRGHDGLQSVWGELIPSDEERGLLASPERPIVLCRKRPDSRLSPAIAPGLDEVGAMLPYSPLHHLLLDRFDGPLVATSGNISGEPVLTDPHEAQSRLGRVADAWLHHDRPILRPADDSLFRVIAGRPRPLRLGRGVAPLELTLPTPVGEPLVAVGGHNKSCVALAWGRRVVVSPHIGDLGTPRSMAIFQRVIEDLQRLYQIRATRLVCDAHPGYGSSRWAARSGLPLQRVLHHHAHASALFGEHGGEEPWLVFAWDGVGLGEGSELWGGEALLGTPGRWRRVASLRPFRLPGGERAGREPWRSAAALCWETGREWPGLPAGSELLREAWQRGVNAPATSAAGRLFDAASALLGLVHTTTFEGQGPMYLEAAAAAGGEAPAAPLPLHEVGGMLVSDWAPLLEPLLDERRGVAERAALFHAAMARVVIDQARAVRERSGVEVVGLTGGVFQNRLLTERVVRGLAAEGFAWRLSERLPCNDGGLSFGQVVETAATVAH